MVASERAQEKAAERRLSNRRIRATLLASSAIAVLIVLAYRALPGPGFTGSYFDGPELSGNVYRRRSRVISFDWREDRPAFLPDARRYSVRWTGAIAADRSDHYTFYVDAR